MRNISAYLSILVAGSVLVSCSSSTPDSSVSGSGGNVSKGGANGLGGTTATVVGGSTAGGALGSGGTTASSTGGSNAAAGGSTSAVGGGSATAAGGSNSGGATAGGTNSSIGGTSTKGGTTATGGTAANVGGATTIGGTTATGGATNAGGATTTAGTKATGGSGATSGATATGGGTAGGQGTTCPTLPAAPTGTSDAVAGTLITFNDNGGWCWYQDERAVVDTAGGKLVIGSVASTGSRDGNIDAVIYDIAAGTKKGPTVLDDMSVDDHNAPAFIVRPDGKYVAMWAGHHFDCNSNYSIYDGSTWATKKAFDWKSEGCTWNNDTTHSITYSNMWYLSAESRIYSGVRSVDTSPNFLASTDNGATWSYYGRLTYTPLTGYVAGYYKYWGNGKDRIDFVGTEAHPRDNDNSLWHGYVKGGKIYNSTGTVVDDAVAGTRAETSAKNVNAYTKAFATGSTVNGVKLEHAWNADIVSYDDGTVAIIGTARVTGTGSDDPDKRLIYLRFDGTSWKTTYLAKAGPKLYADEQDYTGLGALHPDNPHIIYISTTFDPRDDKTNLGKHEIFMGVTCDNGATFKWTPITQGSTVDNIRPIVPKWDASHTALLWMRGTYRKAQDYTMKIVGIISNQ